MILLKMNEDGTNYDLTLLTIVFEYNCDIDIINLLVEKGAFFSDDSYYFFGNYFEQNNIESKIIKLIIFINNNEYLEIEERIFYILKNAIKNNYDLNILKLIFEKIFKKDRSSRK